MLVIANGSIKTMITKRIENGTNVRMPAISPARKETATSHLVQSSQFARWFAKVLLVGLILATFAMAFLPWQQTSRGNGQVVAYVPQERQQVIQAPVKGRVVRIKKGLVEGSKVKKGEFILEIQPFAENQFSQLEDQIKELNTKLDAANFQASSYERMANDLAEARDLAVKGAKDMVEAAQAKLEAKELEVNAYLAKEDQAGKNLKRQNDLYLKKIKPKVQIEILEKEWEVAKAELAAVRKQVIGLQQERAAKVAAVGEKRLMVQTKIDYNLGFQQKALGEAASIRKEIADLEMKRDELKLRNITAPRDGTIFRMPVFEQGQAIKVGDPILTLIPETSQKAVELLVPGNDMPLVQVGQEVRLQFEGWPAVQIPAWPSVAVGTFSGIVSTVDATDDGKGKFRILIVPNDDDQPWPSDQYLRQGVRANGWVMLNKVTLGFEIWRQLNGFPVAISDKEPETKESAKKPKLPKE